MKITVTTDKTLPWVDYSTLSAVNTCPRWGIIHSYYGKRLPSGVDRVLPLEAGRAMHDVFACCRFFDLMNHIKKQEQQWTALDQAVQQHAHKIFDNQIMPDRWHMALEYYNGSEDDETRCMQMCLSLLETSGYHDDPRDTRRTQANLESAAISYVQRYPLGRFIPIHDPLGGYIGIECPFDVTIDDDVLPPIRFIGRVDAVCIDTMRKSDLTPEVHENKTGSRIDTVWSSSFDTSHQVTGYCVAMSTLLQMQVRNVVMWGLQIPIPKSSAYTDGVMRYPTSRDDGQIWEWLKWLSHTRILLEMYKGDPINAPMYTHSCNRYFRACSFIPLCTETEERRKHIYEKEMVSERYSPLEADVAN